jgi:hypothetical protein
MGSGPPVRLRCPDCSKSMGPLAMGPLALDARARVQGTRERSVPYPQWQASVRDAALGAECLAPAPRERVCAPWLRWLGNAARQMYVGIRLTR